MHTSRPITASPPRITMLTDFGTADGYVAAMKGVIAALAPAALIDDAAHDIVPGDVHAAAWALAGYWRRYPPATVHIVVVDPGVGGPRRALAIEADGRFLVGPDNGALSRVLSQVTAPHVVVIEHDVSSGSVAPTFHGRDVFAPAAAHLAVGRPIGDLGRDIADPVMLVQPQATARGGHVHGEVVHVDRFGNLITNIDANLAAGAARVVILGSSCRLLRTYADVEPGALVAVIGSQNLLEIAIRDGSAADTLHARRGELVVVEPVGP
jgi:S-adenosyl-L-methionine hydrolase (adenosine-forming)